MRRLLLTASALVAFTAVTAHAQSDPRVQIVIDGGAQVAASSFRQALTLRKNVQDAPVTTDLQPGTSGFIEAGGRVRVAGPVFVGVLGFYDAGNAQGTLDAQVPHPFYFNQPRDVSADLSGLKRSESGAHVEFGVRVPARDRLSATLFAGPSYFSVTQELVTDFAYADAYPFDTATFTSATTRRVTRGRVGFNVGGDVAWQLNRTVAVAGVVRYSRATVTLSPSAGNDVDVRAGGAQAGAGVRVGF